MGLGFGLGVRVRGQGFMGLGVGLGVMVRVRGQGFMGLGVRVSVRGYEFVRCENIGQHVKFMKTDFQNTQKFKK